MKEFNDELSVTASSCHFISAGIITCDDGNDNMAIFYIDDCENYRYQYCGNMTFVHLNVVDYDCHVLTFMIFMTVNKSCKLYYDEEWRGDCTTMIFVVVFGCLVLITLFVIIVVATIYCTLLASDIKDGNACTRESIAYRVYCCGCIFNYWWK